MHTHAPLFLHMNRVVLRGLKLGQWLQGARLCSMVGLKPAPQPPSDSYPVSFHHLLARAHSLSLGLGREREFRHVRLLTCWKVLHNHIRQGSKTCNTEVFADPKFQCTTLVEHQSATYMYRNTTKLVSPNFIGLYLISVCYLGVWELSRHELKENNSIGIDIRLVAVGIVILHPDNLRSLWTCRQK